ncbi:hypothetical protein [Lactococcus sp. DD01]|nr:hypothetical protein [Lactococcus sp. DD01]KXT63529.1 hypothetical protein LACDD01_00009 [Lactococcus sp. DD01]
MNFNKVIDFILLIGVIKGPIIIDEMKLMISFDSEEVRKLTL